MPERAAETKQVPDDTREELIAKAAGEWAAFQVSSARVSGEPQKSKLTVLFCLRNPPNQAIGGALSRTSANTPGIPARWTLSMAVFSLAGSSGFFTISVLSWSI